MTAGSSPRIRIETLDQRLWVYAGAVRVADTRAAVRLYEHGYPARDYVPRADVCEALLRPAERRTHCPYKGDAHYYHFVVDERWLENAAWSYAQPLEDLDAIAGHLAFDHPALDLRVEPH